MEQIAATPQNYELAATVYEARYQILAERMSDPARSFVTFLHTTMEETPLFQMQGNRGVTGNFYKPSYAKTLETMNTLSGGWPPNPENRSEDDGTRVTLHTIRQADKLLRNKEEPVADKLQALCVLGFIAGSFKPNGAINMDAVNRTMREQDDNFMVFTAAITKIKRMLLSPSDLDKIKFDENDLLDRAKASKAVPTLNRRSLHVYAEKLLERLSSPDTFAFEVFEEIVYLNNALHEPNPNRWRFSLEEPESVTVNWEVFPPDQEKAPNLPPPSKTREPLSEERQAELAAIRREREALVAFFVSLWGKEAFVIDAPMRSKGLPYKVAVLPEQTPDGLKVHAFAESPDLDNASFVLRAENIRGIAVDTTSRETIEESLRTIFGTTKTVAETYGTHRITHNTTRMAEVLLEYLTRSPDQLREARQKKTE